MKMNFFTLSFLLLLFHVCACSNKNTDTTTPYEVKDVPELKSVFINGDSIHYIDTGKGEPVVFVHGGFGDYRTWEEQIDTFAQHYRVISYSKRLSYPNKQIADDSTDVSATAHAKDLGALLKALNLEQIHLVGHSGGGHVALLTTMEHPELIRSLVLGEAVVPPLLQNVPGGDSLLNRLYVQVLKPATEAFRSNDNEKGVRAFINGVIGDSLYFDNLPQRIQENFIANMPEVKQNLLFGGPSEQVTCEDLGKIEVPVLLLYGSQSISFFSSMNDELYRCLSNKEKATIINAGHGLELENPAEFNRIVLDFINGH